MTLFLQFTALEILKQWGFLWKVILCSDRYFDTQKSVERCRVSDVVRVVQ